MKNIDFLNVDDNIIIIFNVRSTDPVRGKMITIKYPHGMKENAEIVFESEGYECHANCEDILMIGVRRKAEGDI